jgi:hypothetical protein
MEAAVRSFERRTAKQMNMVMTKKKPLVLDLKRTYLSAIGDSVGCRMFRHLYMRRGRQSVDVTEGGRVSCSYFVSSLLRWFGMVAAQHATVAGLVRDLESSGWVRIRKPKIGAVLLWEPCDHGGSVNRHVGFYAGSGMAVSNSSKKKVVARHHWTFGEVGRKPVRIIEAIYWHPKLG